MKKPDDAELLAWLDGELSAERRAEIQQQLETDWELRTTLAQLERRIGKYVEATAYQSPAEIEPFDDFWQRVSPQLKDGSDAQTGTSKPNFMLGRLREWKWRDPFPLRLASAITVISLLTIGLLFYLSFSPRLHSVSAEELLQRAVQGEAERVKQWAEPVIYHKLQVRRVDGQTSTPAVLWESWHNTKRQDYRQRVSPSQRISQGQDQTILSELVLIMQANQFDIQRPLSPQTFAEWRKRVVPQSDQITEIELPGEAPQTGLQLTTRTTAPYGQNSIIEAALTVRRNDWHAIALQLRVQRAGLVQTYELRETSFEVLPMEALASFATATTALPMSKPLQLATPILVTPIPTPSPLPINPTPTALQEAEVTALYALHLAQADLGEQLEVVREDNKKIVVRGLVQNASRKEALVQVLRHIALVNPQILTIDEAVQQTQRTASSAGKEAVIDNIEPVSSHPTNTSSVNAFQQRLIEQFGGHRGMTETERDAVNARVTQFYNGVEADASAAMAEAWAMRRLQERFAGTAADLDATSRQRLDEMLNNHTARLHQRVRSLQSRLRPQLVMLANDVAAVTMVPEASRPAKTQAAFRAVEQVRHLTDQLITGHAGNSLPQTARALLMEFARLDAVLSDIEKK